MEEKFIAENSQAEEHLTAGNHPEAAKILVSIVQNDPQNWRAFNNMGILSWIRSNWHDAFTMFKQSVSIKPDYSDALVNLFDAALKLKKVYEVIPFFNKALETDSSLDDIRVIRDQLVEQGDDIYLCKRALQIGVYSPVISEAQKELGFGNYDRALELFLKSNDTEGASAAAFCGMGIVAFYKKQYNDAYSLFLESIKMNPMDTDTFLNLLDAAKVCDKVADAKKVLDVYIKEIPELEELMPVFSNS